MKQHGRSERLWQSMCCSLFRKRRRYVSALVKLGTSKCMEAGGRGGLEGESVWRCGTEGRLSHRHGALCWLWLSVIMLPQRSKCFASIVAGSCRRVADK